MRVLLASRGNPDHGQDPTRPMPGCPNDHWAYAASLRDAASQVRAYIHNYDLGGGNWAGGPVIDAKGDRIGYISYNGRIWTRVQLRSLAILRNNSK